MYDLSRIGEQIKFYRKKLAFTQSDLAKQMNVSFQAVSGWETNAAIPDIQNLCALAQLFGVSLDALLSGTAAEKVMLAVDGGGTKSEFVMFTADGNVQKRFVLPGTNVSVYGFDQVVATLCQGIDQCLYANSDLGSVFIGTAGAQLSQLRDVLAARYPQLRVAVESDGVSAVNMEDADAALICGTGSILVLKEGEGIRRAGGWGYMVGDPGSGFRFGQLLIRLCAAYEDGVGDRREFHEMVCKELNADSLRNKPVPWTPYKIASFARILLDACRQQDPEVCRMVQNEMTQLAHLINASCKDGSRVNLCGGIFQHYGDILIPMLQSSTKEGISYIKPELPPVYGACVACCRWEDIPCGGEFKSNFVRSLETVTFQN